jgi:CHAD domain-containing protein
MPVGGALERHETVHQVRKRCKKLRGLIRLVRPEFKDYQQENQFFRDAARELSYVRDAQSMIECFDRLVDHYAEQVNREAFASIRRQLAERRQRIADDRVDLDKRLDQFLAKMREARQRIDSWKVKDDGFAAVEGGLRKTFGRGRRALREAYENPGDACFHEFRKRTKYHWYHVRLLRPIWGDMLSVQCQAADDLSDLLGGDHDLAVFRTTLLAEPDQFGSEADTQAFVGLIDRRRIELQAEARPLGERLFAEKPAQLAHRFRIYWETWNLRSAGRVGNFCRVSGGGHGMIQTTVGGGGGSRGLRKS